MLSTFTSTVNKKTPRPKARRFLWLATSLASDVARVFAGKLDSRKSKTVPDTSNKRNGDGAAPFYMHLPFSRGPLRQIRFVVDETERPIRTIRLRLAVVVLSQPATQIPRRSFVEIIRLPQTLQDVEIPHRYLHRTHHIVQEPRDRPLVNTLLHRVNSILNAPPKG